MFRSEPVGVTVRRLPRVLFGLLLIGTATSSMVAAGLGLGPWDVFHQGVALRAGIPLGTAVIATGFVVMLVWIPLRERVGVGTLLNAVLVGVVVNLEAAHLPTLTSDVSRWVFMVIGPVLFAVGSGFYIGAGLGPGPRDGLMTGAMQRGLPAWAARGGLELAVLVVGWQLGGSVGFGTVWFAVSIGPLVHWVLPRLSLVAVDHGHITQAGLTGGE